MKFQGSLFPLCAVLALGRAALPAVMASGLQVSPLASPAAARGSDNPALAEAPDGTVWLTWLEASGESALALKFATLAPGGRQWSAARTIFRRSGWVANVFDAPLVVVQDHGRATAAWSAAATDPNGDVGTPRAYVSRTADGGASWGAPQPLSPESESAEYVSLAPLGDERLLAVWIDARGRKTEATAPQLYSRIVGGSGPDTVVDASVCDCCRNSLAALPDGGAVLTYRGRTAAQVRDVLFARYADGRWGQSRSSTDDCWTIEGCPVNGPRVASHGHEVALVWFTGAGGRMRVLTKTSADEGHRFGPTQRVDLGNPVGRVDTLFTAQGAQVVSWLEGAGSHGPAGLYLSEYSGARRLLAPTLVSAVENDAVGRVFPRLALVGGGRQEPPRVILAYVCPGESPHVETLLLTL